jgi:hypothetical protein
MTSMSELLQGNGGRVGNAVSKLINLFLRDARAEATGWPFSGRAVSTALRRGRSSLRATVYHNGRCANSVDAVWNFRENGIGLASEEMCLTP